eukprot:m.1300330 g.1300330  ORF g.1300330 m.1300330 type:complete len:198 (+) comp24802_c1_seq18:1106-1699(+)
MQRCPWCFLPNLACSAVAAWPDGQQQTVELDTKTSPWMLANRLGLSLSTVYEYVCPTTDIEIRVIPIPMTRTHVEVLPVDTLVHQDVHLDNDSNMWWSYKILIHNRSQDTFVLKRRTWFTIDEHDVVHATTTGNGVVGVNPALTPEQPTFQYTSMCRLPYPSSGRMGGQFLFQRGDESVEVFIPTFDLRCPVRTDKS